MTGARQPQRGAGMDGLGLSSVAGAVLLLAAASGNAQEQPPPSKPFVERVDVNVRSVLVLIRDPLGRRLRNPPGVADLEIRENGVPVEIVGSRSRAAGDPARRGRAGGSADERGRPVLRAGSGHRNRAVALSRYRFSPAAVRPEGGGSRPGEPRRDPGRRATRDRRRGRASEGRSREHERSPEDRAGAPVAPKRGRGEGALRRDAPGDASGARAGPLHSDGRAGRDFERNPDAAGVIRRSRVLGGKEIRRAAGHPLSRQ